MMEKRSFLKKLLTLTLSSERSGNSLALKGRGLG